PDGAGGGLRRTRRQEAARHRPGTREGAAAAAGNRRRGIHRGLHGLLRQVGSMGQYPPGPPRGPDGVRPAAAGPGADRGRPVLKREAGGGVVARAAAWSRVGLAVAVVLVLGTAACAGGRSPTGPDGAEGDQRYGPAPVPHPEVTYQPDVVIVGGGSGSVRAVSPDALTWFIDPRAERADDLRPGEIMFLTGRAVGRILDVRRDGEHLAVTLGPVDITEVIRDGTFTAEQPVPLDAPQRHDAGAPFWAEYDADPAGPPETFGPGPVTAGAAVRVGDLAPGSFHVAAAPAAVPAPPRRQAGGFSVTPTCCTGGVGAR